MIYIYLPSSTPTFVTQLKNTVVENTVSGLGYFTNSTNGVSMTK